MIEIPDINGIRSFTADEVKYDSLVRKSVEEGFMTEDELFVGRFVYGFLDENSPVTETDDVDEEHQQWRSKLPEACKAAEQHLGVKAGRARDLFEKSLDIRSRNL